MENEQIEPQMQAPEDAGRGTDTVMAHMSLGEIVIPRAFQDDPQVMEMLQALFQGNGVNIAEFTVGDKANKINPETGYAEFGLFGGNGWLSKALGTAANLILPNAGFAGGFTNGLVQGQGLNGALRQGIGSGATALASYYGGPLAGAAAGGLNASLNGRDPVTGAITGGIGGALSGGSLGGLADTQLGRAVSDTALGRGVSDIYNGVGDALGSVGDTALGRGVSDVYNGATSAIGTLPKALQGPTQSGAPLSGVAGGTGALGSIGRSVGISGAPSLGGALTGSAGGGGSTFSGLNTAANIFGGLNQDAAIKKQQKQLLAANQQQQANLNAASANLDTFDPSNITNDAGYQFNLEQGQQGLNKGLAAGGALYSGKALKAASEYNQNYANNAFNAAYQRWLQKVQGQNALLGGQNELLGQAGNVRAGTTGAAANNVNQSLSNALGAKVGNYGGSGYTLEQLRAMGMVV